MHLRYFRRRSIIFSTYSLSKISYHTLQSQRTLLQIRLSMCSRSQYQSIPSCWSTHPHLRYGLLLHFFPIKLQTLRILSGEKFDACTSRICMGRILRTYLDHLRQHLPKISALLWLQKFIVKTTQSNPQPKRSLHNLIKSCLTIGRNGRTFHSSHRWEQSHGLHKIDLVWVTQRQNNIQNVCQLSSGERSSPPTRSQAQEESLWSAGNRY